MNLGAAMGVTTTSAPKARRPRIFFDAHFVRDRKDTHVALDRSHNRQRHSHVPRSRLNDHASRLEQSPPLRASSITASPILSLTLRPGLEASSFTQTVAKIPAVTRLRRTSGVLPTASSTLAEIFGIRFAPEY